MKKLLAFLLFIFLTSCQVTETININPDGSGNIEVYSRRDENSFIQIGNSSLSSEKFRDTTFVFQDYIIRYHDTFVRYSKSDQELFQKHANVKVQIKVDPVQMENFNIVSYDFKKIEEMPNVYESLLLANSLKENHVINKRSYEIKYTFDGVIFKRHLAINDSVKFEKDKIEFEETRKRLIKNKIAQSYTLHYFFPRKIKSISNQKAILDSDKRSLKLEFQFSDFLENPECTNLEVVLE